MSIDNDAVILVLILVGRFLSNGAREKYILEALYSQWYVPYVAKIYGYTEN